MTKLLFLVDFDGTISDADVGNYLIKEITRKSWSLWVKDMGSMASRQIVEHNFALWNEIDLNREEFFQLVETATKPRPGINQWLEACRTQGHEVYVVSSGLESYVTHLLTKWLSTPLDEDHVITVPCKNHLRYGHARVDIDRIMNDRGFTGYGKGDVAKRLKALYPDRPCVAIGDGRSDVFLANEADRVYARRYLAEHLNKLGRPFQAFDTFLDIEPLA